MRSTTIVFPRLSAQMILIRSMLYVIRPPLAATQGEAL